MNANRRHARIIIAGKAVNRPHIRPVRDTNLDKLMWVCGYPEIPHSLTGLGSTPVAAFDAWKELVQKNDWLRTT